MILSDIPMHVNVISFTVGFKCYQLFQATHQSGFFAIPLGYAGSMRLNSSVMKSLSLCGRADRRQLHSFYSFMYVGKLGESSWFRSSNFWGSFD